MYPIPRKYKGKCAEPVYRTCNQLRQTPSHQLETRIETLWEAVDFERLDKKTSEFYISRRMYREALLIHDRCTEVICQSAKNT